MKHTLNYFEFNGYTASIVVNGNYIVAEYVDTDGSDAEILYNINTNKFSYNCIDDVISAGIIIQRINKLSHAINFLY